MISWMQKHNKYLVWTIWIATIAFIGAGFVGWGSYSFGSKAGNIAKVGEVEVSQNSLNMTYSNLYAQYNQMMEGKLDDAKAKELGLVQQAFSMLTTQAKVLNLAKENGIVISDQELLEALQNIKAFQDDGLFNQEVYNMYLTTQQMNAKTFEARLRDELTISKTFEMLQMDALPFETQVFAAAMGISDQIQYKVLTFNDVNVSVENEKLKSYWEMNKENFKTPKQYTLSLLRTEKSDVAITEEELQAHYTANSFNYTDSEGKQLTLEEAKEAVTKDLQLRKSKKSAQKAYIGMKKG
ncbi:MAG TPA: hypothetical protein ENK72_00145, partial [Epsilonproteobacteria bacterium]|nr:hypothetical protein [Campylobacterota bacterium]